MLLFCCYFAVILLLFCCYFAVLFVVYCYIYNMATKHIIDEEDFGLSGNSTVEYGGTSEYESDCSTDEYPSSIASRSTVMIPMVLLTRK